MTPPPIRIVLVDDHRIVLDGLKGMIQAQPDLECAGTATQGVWALYLLEHLQVDLVLMDLDMPEMDGLQATERIKAKWPDKRVLILSMHDEPAVVQRIMQAGADGYVIKDAGKDELLAAIREVHAGRKYFSSRITESLLDPDPAPPVHASLADLTTREIEVLGALAEGLSNKEIGERLFISPRTVDTHRTNLMKKLGVHHVAGLVRIAIQAGLTD